MNSNILSTRITEMGLDIQKILKKISQLEASNENLIQMLNNEISQRQNLEKHTLNTHEAFSGQLKALKGYYENFDEVINKNIEKFRSDFNENFRKKNSDLIELINNNKNNSQNNLNKNYNNNNVEEKFDKIKQMINNEFIQYKNELNSINVNNEYNSKKLEEIISKFSNDFNNL